MPDEWQEWVLEGWLARNARTGRLASSQCGLSVPRQNGKNACLEIVELFKMVMLGRRILHTAHEVKTARKAFVRIASFFENHRQWPELAELVKEIRRTNGQEAIVLTNGGSVEFIARSKGSGRGFTVDDLVLDEAQELDDDALAALLPTISAAPSQDPQIIFTGTPPSPSMSGEVFTRVRSNGLSKKNRRACWDEWSFLDGVDLDDLQAWAQANPGLGIRLHPDVIRDERTAMDAETFARERGGVWAHERQGGTALSAPRWAELADPGATRADPVAFGLDLSGDRDVWIAVAWQRADGHVQAMLTNDGAALPPRLAVSECVRLQGEWGGAVATSAFGDELEKAGVQVVDITAAEFAVGCGAVADAITDGTIRHGNQPSLNTAVKVARWRSTTAASGERAFQLKDCPEVGPLAAVARAVRGLATAQVNVWGFFE